MQHRLINARIEAHGLLENRGANTQGVPNVRQLTPRGKELLQAPATRPATGKATSRQAKQHEEWGVRMQSSVSQTAARPMAQAGLFAAVVSAVVVLCAFGAGPSFAASAHLAASPFAPALAAAPSEVGTEGEGAGQFKTPTGIAINQQSGDVYTADEENNRVDQFSGAGAFLRTWGWGVRDGESEEFQVCEAPGPCFAGLGGTGGGQLALPRGVAVDNSAGLSHGDVYVEDPTRHRIEHFDSEGHLIWTLGGKVNATTHGDVCLAGEACQEGTFGSAGASEFEALGRNGIAVGPTGTVYVGDIERVQKFSAAGAPEGEIKLSGAGAVELLAVDSSGELYVLSSELQGIRKYDGAGTELGEARDPGVGGLAPSIALGPGDELLISDPQKGPILRYDAAGVQRGSFAEQGSDASGGIALNESTQALYAIHVRPSRVTVQTLPGGGPVILEGSQRASEVLPTSAKLNATINPEGPEVSEYHFEYGTTEAYGSQTSETPLEGGEEGEFKDQPISAPISGLQPSTTYHFRVVAENAAKEVTLGPDETFQTLPAVSIESESAAAVTATSAKLLAELNPHGLDSEYHFEYGLTSTYEKSAPLPDADAGEGSSGEVFGVDIQELQPNTLYHYRVVAHNSLGVVQGPDQTFRTQGVEAPASIDGRGDEMVSPPDKHGVSLEGLPLAGGVLEATKGGDALAYFALGPIDESPPGSRSSDYSQLLGRRGGAGSWSTQDIATPHDGPAGINAESTTEYKLFSSDLSRGAVEPSGTTPLSPQASEPTPYLREADGSYTPLLNSVNVTAQTKFGEPRAHFVTGTADLSHVLLRSPNSLLQGFENEGVESVYEWNEGKLAPVSVLPSGAPVSEEGAHVGNRDRQVRGAISADGGRAFFTTTPQGRLYMREMPREGTPGQTLRVDAAAPGVKASEGGATFQLANSEGSKVLFTDQNKLTKDATAIPGEPDLYECEVVREGGKLACKLSDLSVDPNPGEAADVQGDVIGTDESARYVYYVAKGALSEGAAREDRCPPPASGQCVNLYAYDTVAHSKRLVAVLSEEDAPDWRAGITGQLEDLGEMTSRVSPDGRYLAFMSQRSLTGYDNRDAHSGARDEEVFLYDYETNELRCASCDTSGQRPVGALDESTPGPLVDRLNLWKGHWLAASIPGWTRVDTAHALHQPRYLSNSGRLFFNSAQALVSADGNGTQDVYEFEPKGIGGCGEGPGCVSLISSGSSSEETSFLEASEDGDDVFFLTTAQLSGADKDNAFDIYDAHVCSLAPGCAPAIGGSPPPCVSSDACRAAPAAQPDNFGAPASSTFNGAGNPVAGKAAEAKAKPPTRAQLLARALKACKKQRSQKARARCVKKAKARYGPRHSAKKGSRAAARKAKLAGGGGRRGQASSRSDGFTTGGTTTNKGTKQ